MDAVREHVFRLMGYNEIWVDAIGDGGVTTVDKTFAKTNFDVFMYDPMTGHAALRPANGMHKRLLDYAERLPDANATDRLATEDKLAMYLFSTAEDVAKYQSGTYEDDEWCDIYDVEWIYRTTEQEFKTCHPNAISLLI